MNGGSSPLARGAQKNLAVFQYLDGLIPAGAGSTPCRRNTTVLFPAHPRWRGEHKRCSNISSSSPGSSPLARGALQDLADYTGLDRLIPAGAGSTWVAVSSSPQGRAHPRWRGEHTIALHLTECPRGSSPLARGAPRREQRRVRSDGLIPAGAGSTRSRSPPALTMWAHPRWRGEHGGFFVG